MGVAHFDIIPFLLGFKESIDAFGGEPAFGHRLREHGLGVREQGFGLNPNHLIF